MIDYSCHIVEVKIFIRFFVVYGMTELTKEQLNSDFFLIK